MNSGMLWYDDDHQADLVKRIRNAVAYFSAKYGQRPDLCFVHPSMLTNANHTSMEIEVRGNPLINPDYFWLGVQKRV